MTTNSTPRILIFGNANVDLVMGEIDRWPKVGTEVQMSRSEMRAGGSAGNSSLALSGLEVPHRYISTIGTDVNGKWLKGEFDPACCDWIETDDATTLTVGIVHKGGDRAFFTTPGHLLTADATSLIDRIPNAPEGVAIALISGQFLMPELCKGVADLMKALSAKGWETAIDPGWPPQGWDDTAKGYLREWLALCDYALLNDEELRAAVNEKDEERAGVRLGEKMKAHSHLIIKRGPRGAIALTGGERYERIAPPVTVIDTVGAGDTFNAAFIAKLTEGEGMGNALQAGVSTASRVISTYPRSYK
ncbi:carbohydrate kinase family protein [Rhodobacteraceae bacterium RKSG542]|uniref:carbohydrate kinase family protein n=1 Tax=Pseudovibrio flavus TaxID=2529854 RepID=UPI0012BBFFC6|nr:carbohydrate kinase family protein [Pseudovibrio flavus]MTI16183.1 carbohydrate kinase family protein [Pseudovibrio flavus]